jgi:S-disulfanyl-L-cysteine oxidoreductase SoxD
MPSRLTRFAMSLSACALAGSLTGAAQTPPPAPSAASGPSTPARTAKDGVYSDAQARRGQALYKDRCAACHGATLGGGNAPPLAGDAFIAVWGGPLSDLVDKIQNTMPQDDPGKLTRQQAADIVAHMLQASKFPAGRTDLGVEDAVLKQIAIAPGQTPRPAMAVAGAQAPSFPPAGNLNQVMRGILFPSSNIIFNVQTHDPGAPLPKRPPNQSTDAAFSMTDWGAGIYKGWEIIDYAAIAIAESAPLLLTPGRRCENGRPVPVQDADWIKYTLELAETGKAAYKASQTRKQDVVSDITEQIANACLHCHQVYRDKRGRNPADLSNQSARCVK